MIGIVHRLPAVLVAFSLLSSQPLSAQRTTGSIVGQLRVVPGTDVGRPLLVNVEARGAIVDSAYCDEEGRFGFNNLPGNIYHIKINDDAYLPIAETVVVDPDTTAVRLVSIMLTPRTTEKAEDSAPIAGGNPNLVNYAETDDLFPASAVREFKAGIDSDKKHEVDQAIKHYQQAIKGAPNFYHARNNLGTDYLSKREYTKAREQFLQAIHLNGEDGAAYFNLGNAHYLEHQYDAARQWLDQGLSKEPSSALGHFLKGSVEGATGNVVEAEKQLLRSLELDPKMSKTHLALVNLYLQQKRNEEAANELRAFLKESPNDPLAAQATAVLKRIAPAR
jgi:Flp pilus assembly protein TadD